MVRFNTNGSPDTSFGGGDGIVITPIGGGAFPRNEITGVAVQHDGRIVVGGNGNDGGGNTNNVIRLARYLSNGNLDATFGTGGIVTTNLGSDRFDRAADIALQRDEKVVVFGHSLQLFVTNDDFVIARYNWDDGSLDTTYGTTNQGYTRLAATPGSDSAVDGVLYPDGSAALGGTTGSSDFGAARFRGDPAPVIPGRALARRSHPIRDGSTTTASPTTPPRRSADRAATTATPRSCGSTGRSATPLARALCRTGA